MEKIITKEPIYETKKVQVGEYERVKWITSDGEEFDNENSAKYHEFYVLKVKKRYIGFNGVDIFDFTSVEDLEKYLCEYGYGIDKHDYNKEELEFPNTYVLSEEDIIDETYGYDSWGQPEKEDRYLRIYTFDEYKQKVINELEELRF